MTVTVTGNDIVLPTSKVRQDLSSIPDLPKAVAKPDAGLRGLDHCMPFRLYSRFLSDIVLRQE